MRSPEGGFHIGRAETSVTRNLSRVQTHREFWNRDKSRCDTVQQEWNALLGLGDQREPNPWDDTCCAHFFRLASRIVETPVSAPMRRFRIYRIEYGQLSFVYQLMVFPEKSHIDSHVARQSQVVLNVVRKAVGDDSQVILAL